MARYAINILPAPVGVGSELTFSPFGVLCHEDVPVMDADRINDTDVQVFFVVWVLATTWFTTWVVCKGKVRVLWD